MTPGTSRSWLQGLIILLLFLVLAGQVFLIIRAPDTVPRSVPTRIISLKDLERSISDARLSSPNLLKRHQQEELVRIIESARPLYLELDRLQSRLLDTLRPEQVKAMIEHQEEIRRLQPHSDEWEATPDISAALALLARKAAGPRSAPAAHGKPQLIDRRIFPAEFSFLPRGILFLDTLPGLAVDANQARDLLPPMVEAQEIRERIRRIEINANELLSREQVEYLLRKLPNSAPTPSAR